MEPQKEKRFETSQAEETPYPAEVPGPPTSGTSPTKPRGMSGWMLASLLVLLALLFLYWLL